MSEDRMPGAGLNLRKEQWRNVAHRRIETQRSIRKQIQGDEIKRISRLIAQIEDPEEFRTYPPDAEIPMGRAALSRLYHDSQQSKDKDRALFAQQGLEILKDRWTTVGHVATRDTVRRIVPYRQGSPWVPFTRG